MVAARKRSCLTQVTNRDTHSCSLVHITTRVSCVYEVSCAFVLSSQRTAEEIISSAMDSK